MKPNLFVLVLSFCYFSFFQQHQVFASVTYVQYELYNSSDCASSGLQGFKIVALDGDCLPAPNNPSSGNLYNCGSGTVQNWLVDSLTCSKTYKNFTYTTLPMTTCYSVEKQYSAVNSTLYYKYSCKNGVVVGRITSTTQTCSQLLPNSYGNTLSYYPEGTCYNEISITTPLTASSFIPSVASASRLVFVNGTMVSEYTWSSFNDCPGSPLPTVETNYTINQCNSTGNGNEVIEFTGKANFPGNNKGGIDAGEIAGIVIGVVVGLAAVAGIALFVKRKQKSRTNTPGAQVSSDGKA